MASESINLETPSRRPGRGSKNAFIMMVTAQCYLRPPLHWTLDSESSADERHITACTKLPVWS